MRGPMSEDLASRELLFVRMLANMILKCAVKDIYQRQLPRSCIHKRGVVNARRRDKRR